MRNSRRFWKERWETRAESDLDSYEIDRGIQVKDEYLHKLSQRELFDFVGAQKNECILDAGCGTGINSEMLSRTVAKRVIAIDYSYGMVRRVRERMKKYKVTNADALVASIDHIPIKDNFFDRIICISVFQYLDDDQCNLALAEFIRVSKNGATLILHFKNLFSIYLATLYAIKKIKATLFKYDVKIEHYRSFKYYEKTIESLGGTVVDFNSFNILYIEILPHFLRKSIQILEKKLYQRGYWRDKFIWKFGSEYKIKVVISK